MNLSFQTNGLLSAFNPYYLCTNAWKNQGRLLWTEPYGHVLLLYGRGFQSLFSKESRVCGSRILTVFVGDTFGSIFCCADIARLQWG